MRAHDPIHLDPKNKGLLHKTLGVPEGENIPVEKLEEAARSPDETVRKRAQFALNARKFDHSHGSQPADDTEDEADRQSKGLEEQVEKRSADIRSRRPRAPGERH